MKRLTKEQIFILHRELIDAHGGGDGIRGHKYVFN